MTDHRSRKNKSPAFQFYPADWLASNKVKLMSPFARGCYIQLLACAWGEDDCGLPDDDASLAKLSEAGKEWKRVSAQVRACFVTKDGRLYNERLLKEYKHQADYREKCSSAGREGAKQRWKKDSSPMTLPSDENGEAIRSPSNHNSHAIISPMAKNSISIPISDLYLDLEDPIRSGGGMGEGENRANRNPSDVLRMLSELRSSAKLHGMTPDALADLCAGLETGDREQAGARWLKRIHAHDARDTRHVVVDALWKLATDVREGVKLPRNPAAWLNKATRITRKGSQ